MAKIKCFEVGDRIHLDRHPDAIPRLTPQVGWVDVVAVDGNWINTRRKSPTATHYLSLNVSSPFPYKIVDHRKRNRTAAIPVSRKPLEHS